MAKDLKKDYRAIVEDHFPKEMKISFGGHTLIYKKRRWTIKEEDGNSVEMGLRYGENPGQRAALYELTNGNLMLGDCHFIDPDNGLVSAIRSEDILQSGKHPGKINLTDVDSALNILKYLSKQPAVAVMKHNNPAGVAIADDIAAAFEKAYLADRLASFGGCIVLNRAVDTKTAEMISECYFEVVTAPEFDDGVLDVLRKRKNLRILRINQMHELAKYSNLQFVDFKSLIDGGIIVQESYKTSVKTKNDLQLAETTYKGRISRIERAPSEKEYDDMIFGWHVTEGTSSNSVVFVKDGVTIGIGTGEQDRVGVAEIARDKAYKKFADRLSYQKFKMTYATLVDKIKSGEESKESKEEIDSQVKEERGNLFGSVMISDAFFPFRDGVDVGIREGIKAIVHPGGSINDYQSIQACNEAEPKVTMVFTGQRCFRH